MTLNFIDQMHVGVICWDEKYQSGWFILQNMQCAFPTLSSYYLDSETFS